MFYQCTSNNLVEVIEFDDVRLTSRRVKLICNRLQELMPAENGAITSAIISDMSADDGNVSIAIMERLIGMRVHRLIMADCTNKWFERDYGFGGIQ